MYEADRSGQSQTTRNSLSNRRSPSCRSRRIGRGYGKGIEGGSPRGRRAERAESRVFELAGGTLGIRSVKDGGSGDDDAGAGHHDRTDVLEVDAAVDFDEGRVVRPIEQSPHVSDLELASSDERLSPEPRVDGHHQDEIDVSGNLLQGTHRRRRVQDDSRLDSERLD